MSGSLDEDLDRLAHILEDDVPAYVLARLDDPAGEWLVVFYVPETAKVRDKVHRSMTRPRKMYLIYLPLTITDVIRVLTLIADKVAWINPI